MRRGSILKTACGLKHHLIKEKLHMDSEYAALFFPPPSLPAVITASLEPLVCLTSLWHVMITSQVYELISHQEVDGEWWHWPIQRTLSKTVFQHLQTFKLDFWRDIGSFSSHTWGNKTRYLTPKHYLFPTLTKCFFVPKCNESINHDGVIPMFPQG